MRRDSWLVTKDLIQQEKDGSCMYCHASRGKEHKKGCVLRERTVVVDVTMRLVRKVPEDWDPHLIEFQWNEGSTCWDSILKDLEEHSERCGCLCAVSKMKYVDEAGPGDEEYCRMYIDPDKMKNEDNLSLSLLPKPEHFE